MHKKYTLGFLTITCSILFGLENNNNIFEHIENNRFQEARKEIELLSHSGFKTFATKHFNTEMIKYKKKNIMHNNRICESLDFHNFYPAQREIRSLCPSEFKKFSCASFTEIFNNSIPGKYKQIKDALEGLDTISTANQEHYRILYSGINDLLKKKAKNNNEKMLQNREISLSKQKLEKYIIDFIGDQWLLEDNIKKINSNRKKAKQK